MHRHLIEYRGRAQFGDCFLITRERMTVNSGPGGKERNQPTGSQL